MWPIASPALLHIAARTRWRSALHITIPAPKACLCCRVANKMGVFKISRAETRACGGEGPLLISAPRDGSGDNSAEHSPCCAHTAEGHLSGHTSQAKAPSVRMYIRAAASEAFEQPRLELAGANELHSLKRLLMGITAAHS